MLNRDFDIRWDEERQVYVVSCKSCMQEFSDQNQARAQNKFMTHNCTSRG